MEGTTLYATCMMYPDGDSGVKGIVRLCQPAGGKTRICATISGLTEGQHGFHIHQFGNLTEGCKTAGPHFNPHFGSCNFGPRNRSTQIRSTCWAYVSREINLGNMSGRALFVYPRISSCETWNTSKVKSSRDTSKATRPNTNTAWSCNLSSTRY